MNQLTAQTNLEKLMRKYATYGAEDTEGIHHFARVVYAAEHKKPFPLKGHNPWELYETVPGWEQASAALTDAAMDLWMAIQGIDPDAGVQGRGNDRLSTYVIASPADTERYKQALEIISGMWPDPGMCAELVPEYVGPNDGRMRADTLWYALNEARKALGKPTYPRPEHWNR